jgi:PAS domain S-box-containing protein
MAKKKGNAQKPRNTRSARNSDRSAQAKVARAAERVAAGAKSIVVFTLDRQGRIRELDETATHFLGFPAGWLVGRAFVVFVARQDVQLFLNVLMDSTKTTEPCVVNLDLDRGMTTLPVQLTVVTSTTSEVVHRISLIDLSQVIPTDEQQQKSLSNWYSLLHNAPDTILTVTSQGVIRFVNKPMWGYSQHALVNTSLLEYVPESQHPKILRCLIQSFRFSKRSMLDITQIGGDSSRWFNFSFGTPHVSDLSGSAERTTTVVIREISEDKRREDSLRVSGEQFRDFAARVEAVREEERTRVAREIHDELGGALTALKLELAWLRNKTGQNAKIRGKMKSMIADVDLTIEKVRQISSDLRPSVLDDLGLIPAMEWLLAQFRKRTRIRTEFNCIDENLTLSTDASAAVFRVLQEALTNVIRHAKATKVTVNLEYLRNAVLISILDNGRGMTKGKEADLKSLGIVGMKERVARLGGQFEIFSEPGKGTRIDIIIPLEE